MCTCFYAHRKIVAIDPVDPDDVVVEGGSAHSVRHCLDPVPHAEWEHWPRIESLDDVGERRVSGPAGAALTRGIAAIRAHDYTAGYSELLSALASGLRADDIAEIPSQLEKAVAEGRLDASIGAWANEVFLTRDLPEYLALGQRFSHIHESESTASEAAMLTTFILSVVTPKAR